MPLSNSSIDEVLCLSETIYDFSAATVLVIGDVMLDEYFFGTPTRISPEAPVPVFKTLSQEHRLGGAANTAANVAALGAKVKLVGVVGDDEDGHLVAELLSRAGVDTSGLIKAPQPFRTTKKRRYLTDDSHVFRPTYSGSTQKCFLGIGI